jgi:hypothetical protein
MKIFLAGSGWNQHCWENRDFFDFNRSSDSLLEIEKKLSNLLKD